MNRLIALHGLPRSGKDTLADYLVQQHGFTKMAFADSLYGELARMFDVLPSSLRSHEAKTVPQDWLQNTRADDPEYRRYLYDRGEDQYEYRTSRYHLINYGNEYTGSRNPLKWAGLMSKRLMETPGDIVVPDLRGYPDMREYAALRNSTGTNPRKLFVVNVLREGTSATDHASDLPLPEYLINGTIKNVEGYLEVAFARMQEILAEVDSRPQ